jgi:hypothetical protein
MKKVVIIIAALGLSFSGLAQEKYVVAASTALTKSQNLEEAKENIDKAMLDPETKDKPKALFVKGEVYMAMQMNEKYRAGNPYREASKSLVKLAETKADYEKATVDQLLAVCGIYFYNDGVKAYNDKKYDEAIEFMRSVIKIRDLNGGKRFEKFPAQIQKSFDSAVANANQTIAMSYYNQGKYEEAIPLLVSVKSNPITKTPAIYESLIYAYNILKKTPEAYATIQEARVAYPDDVNIRNSELNYFIQAGKQDDLAKKLEDASAKDPNNADILFNLATTYLTMANPKTGPKPANAAELYVKAEDAYQRALKIAPDNASYNYNFGALYFNQATEVNDQMNAITGTSDADNKKYDDLKAKRDALFGKSMPYFEKAYTIFSGQEKTMRDEDKRTYKSTILALKEVYSRQNKLDKSAEMKKKYESL